MKLEVNTYKNLIVFNF